MRFSILTLFPDWFGPIFGDSMFLRAREAGTLELNVVNFRDYAPGKHHQVDDPPYGGGGGMLLKPEPLSAALDAVAGAPGSPGRAHVICTSPRGATFSQVRARELALLPHVVIVCGHYEGIDQRVIDSRIDEEVSIGDFVLTGGEIPALAIVDAVSRMIPGFLGNADSAAQDSFFDGLLEGPHYTRPEVFEGVRVPDVLLSGNHAAIAKWRLEQAKEVTLARRPELHAAWVAAHPEPIKKRRRRPDPS